MQLLLLYAIAAPAQTLAHRNWAGSGITVDPWWRGAELYRIDPLSFQDSDGDGFGDLHGIADRLDYLQALGVEALVLSPFPLQPGLTPIEPTYGTDDDLGRLIAECTRRRMRVLVDLPLSSARTEAETLAAARFLLTRGVAGLRLTQDPVAPVSGQQRAERVAGLRRLTLTFPGQRILFSDLGSPVAAPQIAYRRAGRHRKTSALGKEEVELTTSGSLAASPLLSAAAVRVSLYAGLEGDLHTVNVTDTTQTLRSVTRLGPEAASRLIATVLLAGRGDPMLLFGQEVGMASAGTSWAPTPMQWTPTGGFTTGKPWLDFGPNAASANVASEEADPDSLLNWYRRLGALRHSNAALRSGSQELIETGNPDVVAWLRRGRGGEAVAVVVNVSGRTQLVAVPRVGQLRVLAATYPTAGAVLGNVVSLPAYGVFVGEVQRAAGLESVVLPARRRRR